MSLYPRHGCVITELRPTAAGRNLLWSRPSAPLHDLDGSIAPGPAIDQFDETVFAGGWFGMFPLAGIPGAGDTDIPMHGDVPRIAWEVARLDPDSAVCTARTPSGFDVERSLRLDGPSLRVATRARNVSGVERIATWGEHPCFARDVFAGGSLSIDASSAFITPEASDPAATRFAPGQRFDWPRALGVHGGYDDVTLVPTIADGRHDHVCATLAAPDLEVTAPGLGGRIRVSVDLTSTPELLYWQHFLPDSSPWSGDVFGLEVCSAPGRTLDDARAANAVSVVAPEGVVEWSMTVAWLQD